MQVNKRAMGTTLQYNNNNEKGIVLKFHLLLYLVCIITAVQQSSIMGMQQSGKLQKKNFLETTNSSLHSKFSPFDTINTNKKILNSNTHKKENTKDFILATLVIVPIAAIAVLSQLSADNFDSQPRLPDCDFHYAQRDTDFLLIQGMLTFIITSIATIACVCVDEHL
jgi:hypothetical protein